MIKRLLILMALFLSQSGLAYDVTDNLKLHGFFTQHAIHTSANNMYGDSENSVSTDFTEAALNVFYSPWEKLSFSFQGLYRNAGDVDNDTLDVDYAFIDLTMKKHNIGRYGLRLGRVKNPIGLYNETRDVAFTTPSIVLPQGIYYERSRSLLLSSDGGQFYLEKDLDDATLSAKLNYGRPRNDNDELLHAIIPFPSATIPLTPTGDLDTSFSDPLLVANLNYELHGGEFIYAFTYADATLRYDPGHNDPYDDGTSNFKLYVLSAQYNGEKFNLTAEYMYKDNEFKDFGAFYPDSKTTSESWYVQAGYRFRPNWQVYARYDEQIQNNDEKHGKNFDPLGLPRHMAFAKDAMVGIRWDINSTMMVRAEYHNINGTSWLTTADNPDRSQTDRYWDMAALQFSLRF